MRVNVVTSTSDAAAVEHDEVVPGDSVELADGDIGVVLRAGPGGAWVEVADGRLEEVSWAALTLVVHPEDPRIADQVPARALIVAGPPRAPRAAPLRGAASSGCDA